MPSDHWVGTSVNVNPMPDIRDVTTHVGVSLAKAVRWATAQDPADRCPTAADLDAALAGLPPTVTEISRVQVHASHERCWKAVRGADQHTFDICVMPPWVPGDKTRAVRVSHRSSGHAVKALCGQPQGETAVLVHLRKAFDNLRTC